MLATKSTPYALRAKAEIHDRQSRECWRAGLAAAAEKHTDLARNLRQLAKEAETARMGE